MGHTQDLGLLSPVTAGHDASVSDAAVLRALIDAELALVRAWKRLSVAPAEAAAEITSVWAESGAADGIDLEQLALDSVAGGNPVIPLVGLLRKGLSNASAPWVHRGATSQDILDTALMLIAAQARTHIDEHLSRATTALRALSVEHRDTVVAARTLTQHAVPTTLGARASNWLRGLERATTALYSAELPAQLGGAGGTLASFVEIGGRGAAVRLPEIYAGELGLAAPEAPWHVTRWPITELGDALVQVIDAAAKVAGDVALLSRTEIGELAEGVGGGSSAMPQKSNPTASVLIRSAGLRAPHLGATLHTASALAVDERPDGSWHAEWSALRELLRLALGATATLATLTEGLRVDTHAVSRNLAFSGGLIVAERLSLVLGPIIGADAVKEIISAAASGEDLATLVRALPEASGIDIDALLDPAQYTGLAGELVDRVLDEEHV